MGRPLERAASSHASIATSTSATASAGVSPGGKAVGEVRDVGHPGFVDVAPAHVDPAHGSHRSEADASDLAARFRYDRAPLIEDALDVGAYVSPGLGAFDPRHQQLVVPGVTMTYRGDDGEGDRFGVERTTGGASTNTAATPGRCVRGDGLGSLGGTAREELRDRRGEAAIHVPVLATPPLLVAQATAES